MSDIAGEGMSPNDPIKDILLNLIEDLSAIHDRDDLYPTAETRDEASWASVRIAEDRLREVTGDE